MIKSNHVEKKLSCTCKKKDMKSVVDNNAKFLQH